MRVCNMLTALYNTNTNAPYNADSRASARDFVWLMKVWLATI